MFLKRAICVVALTVLTVAAFGQTPGRPAPNAFLNKEVRSTAELIAHVKSNPEVMDRYMRHYGMTRAEVIAFLGTLRPSTLPEDGVYPVYSVPEGGNIRLNLVRYKKGRRTFALPDGTNELIMECGNPLSMGPKQVVALNNSPVTTTEVIAEEVPVQITTEIGTEYEPLAALQPTEPVYTFTTPEVTPIPIPLGGGFNPLPLALGGLAFIPTGGGGSVVPEPMTMAAFGLGVAFLGMRRRKNAK